MCPSKVAVHWLRLHILIVLSAEAVRKESTPKARTSHIAAECPLSIYWHAKFVHTLAVVSQEPEITASSKKLKQETFEVWPSNVRTSFFERQSYTCIFESAPPLYNKSTISPFVTCVCWRSKRIDKPGMRCKIEFQLGLGDVAN